ncbi:MAG: sulfatase [Planctomycetota bacterium]
MNMLVTVADSLRVDHLGFHGADVQTPNLDRLAAESAVFENTYAENLPTLPARTAMWTGRYLFPSRPWEPFHVDDVLLAELLWERGYASALVTDTYHMHKPGYNCGRGFDAVRFVRGQEYDPWVVDDVPIDLGRWYRFRGDEDDAMWRGRAEQYLRNRTRFVNEEDHCTPRVIHAALDWLDDVADGPDPFFLWVDCFDPHEPWDPPEPFRSMYVPHYDGEELIEPIPGPVDGYMTERELRHTRALYAGQVSFLDKWLGVLLDRVRDLGLLDDTLVVFTSDHGEPLGEHGIIRKTGRVICYEPSAHVPLFIRHPDGVGSGERLTGFVQPPDLAPTLLDAAEIDVDAPFTGHTLMPMLRGETDGGRDFAVTAHNPKQWSIRTDEWTYLLHIDGERPEELYRRADDPLEQRNVIDAHRDVADELEQRLRACADEVARQRSYQP